MFAKEGNVPNVIIAVSDFFSFSGVVRFSSSNQIKT